MLTQPRPLGELGVYALGGGGGGGGAISPKRTHGS